MEIFNFDLVAILLFILPGYYLLLFAGWKFQNTFTHAVNCLFFGILIAFVMNYIYPINKYSEILSNPLAGAVILSLWGMVIGFFVKLFTGQITSYFK